MAILQRLRPAAARLAPLALVATLAANGIPVGVNDGCCDMPASHCNRAARMVACSCDVSAQPANEPLPLSSTTLTSSNLTVTTAAAPPVASQSVLTASRGSVGLGRWLVPLPILHVTLLI